MYSLVRPILFRFDAEKAHHFTLNSLRSIEKLGLLPKVNSNTRPTELMGLQLPNPVGLAAGLDKNGECIDAFAALGFGFVEIGTVTPKPQPGNPQPRLFRVPEHQGIINRMGFNNHGIDAMIRNIENSRFKGILGINIGKNAVTPIENAADDYLICLEKAYAHASYITVNISSPNTKNLRALQGGDELSALLEALKNKQAQLAAAHGKYVPLAVKIAPDLDETQIADIAHVVQNVEMEGIIATNTTIARDGLGLTSDMTKVKEIGAGGLSGAPLKPRSLEVLRLLKREIGDDLAIISVGGVTTAEDVQERLDAGADLVQGYTAFLYEGPLWAAHINRGLVKLRRARR